MNHDAHIEFPDALKGIDADPAGLVPFRPETEDERDEVRRELERILTSPHFKTSTRAPVLLRQIVECTITGRSGQLKERVLGVEVFGRDPDYDTSLDPVVRVTASRIRQRIAKFYADSEPAPVRVNLPSGSYAAEFFAPAPALPPVMEPEALEADSRKAQARFRVEHPLRLTSCAAAFVAVVAGGIWAVQAWRNDAFRNFWGPVLTANDTITLCVGRGLMTIQPEAAPQPLTIVTQRHQDYVNWADAQTLARVSEMLASKGKATVFRQEGSTSLTDLRRGPAVLIGAFNNDWALRLTPGLRFRFDRDRSVNMLWIVDAQNPAKRDWKLVYSNAYAGTREDYGVITRVLDPTTERTVVIVGGLGSHATIAAGEFLTNPRYMAALSQRAPSGWQEKNLQIVFATTVINGNSGPPRILVVHAW